MAKGSGHLTDGDAAYDNPSRVEPKRSHQWFAGASEPELFPNKKQAVQTPNGKSTTGILNGNPLPSGNVSNLLPSVPSQFMDRLFGEEHNMGSGQAYNPGNETDFITMGKGYSKEDESVMLMGHTYKGNSNIRSMGYAFEKGDDSNISIGHGYHKEGFTGLSFGGFQEEPDMDPLARPLSSYEFTFDQSSVQTSETPNTNELDESTATPLTVSKVAKPRPNSASKNKSEQKGTRKEKEAPNSFPWNVKTLISTGILDGVPVKYISVSREELAGVVKGPGYLCGCQSCNFSKVLNAHEYERHAGCKTKHPNNHIYFENGKSTYQVVQELRSIPESQLYDAILTATGSPINEKAFLSWKESFQAATRELQRIYGKEDLHS